MRTTGLVEKRQIYIFIFLHALPIHVMRSELCTVHTTKATKSVVVVLR